MAEGKTTGQAGEGGANLAYTKKKHPSRSLRLRSGGFGIGGGYERPYRKEKGKQPIVGGQTYGPVPHSGYYGGGTGAWRFEVGDAGFGDEMDWYKEQYGEETSGYTGKK